MMVLMLMIDSGKRRMVSGRVVQEVLRRLFDNWIVEIALQFQG